MVDTRGDTPLSFVNGLELTEGQESAWRMR